MRTVITYGTFDLFHQGHYNILKRAKAEGDYLIVGVTGETYDSERGKLSVKDSLATRIANVLETGFVDKVIVEEYIGQKISDILKYHVDVLVIGSDWKGKFDHLRKYCEVKYLERTKDISSTQIRQASFSIHKLGIVTDDLHDNGDIIEMKAVSGIHPQSVFSQDANLARQYCEKFELNNAFSDFKAFLADVDIVYVRTGENNRYSYVRGAIEAGKHVIADAPYTLDADELATVKIEAAERNLILFEKVPILYQQTFAQLLWMAQGHLIGDIVNVRSTVSRPMFRNGETYSPVDLAYYPIAATIKILGADFVGTHSRVKRDDEGNVEYVYIELDYASSVAVIEIYMNASVNDGMRIVGSEGIIEVPDEWWDGAYFKVFFHEDNHVKRYTANSDGTGFRYLVQSLLRETSRNDVSYSPGITDIEAEAIRRVLAETVNQSL